MLLLFETGTRTSLETLRRRLQHASHFMKSHAVSAASSSHQVALLMVDVQLAIPNTVTQPSLEEAQAAVTRAVQTILATTEQVTPWKHFNRQQLHLQKVWHQLLADAAEVFAIDISTITSSRKCLDCL